MSRVNLSSVTKHYGQTVAVHEFDLDVPDGEFITLLGPSGCGKTTTLRMVAGLIEPTSGQIYFDEQDVTYLPPPVRNIGFVFQTPALFPHLSVADNIAFGLSVKGEKKERIQGRVDEMLTLVNLRDYGKRMPAQLSGGQQQRVAVARAVVHQPNLILADEPTGNLDSEHGAEVMKILVKLHEEGTSIVMVTHSPDNAAYAERRVRMLDGRILSEQRS